VVLDGDNKIYSLCQSELGPHFSATTRKTDLSGGEIDPADEDGFAFRPIKTLFVFAPWRIILRGK